LSRDARHGVDPLAQARERLICLRGCRLMRPACAVASAVAATIGRALSSAAADSSSRRRLDLPAPHLLDDLTTCVWMSCTSRRLPPRRRTLLGQAAHLVGTTANPLPCCRHARPRWRR